MHKRIVDGAALYRSDKLKKVEPASFRAEYANLIPLAEATGVFECNPERVWSDVYSYNRDDVTPDMVVQILDEFERVGMLHRWEENGKVWGYFNGIEKAGRLPGVASLKRGDFKTKDLPKAPIINKIQTTCEPHGEHMGNTCESHARFWFWFWYRFWLWYRFWFWVGNTKKRRPKICFKTNSKTMYRCRHVSGKGDQLSGKA